ncbi:MAG: methionine--tRNA ligase [Candidatus Sumerlaeaceae bacterium]|nr:methionine--tRNA ligase [Candidatus Sumerlaeaceae bacterium]
MTDTIGKIFIGVAWPYANGEQHIGHIAGAYLPPDIFARYQRMRGREVLMVSGSDTHGTPITVRADDEGTTPAEVVKKFHPRFIESYLKLGLTFDLFTHTDTKNHWDCTHDMFRHHLDGGYIYKDTQKQVYDPQAERFLPDRYVEGTCPRCGYADARGDQCDSCGSTYDATELLNPRSKITGNTSLEARDTEHFFLDLGKMNEPLLEWINQPHEHWRASVLNYTRTQLAERKLRGRAITRDLTWGITVPLEGYDTKRIYVWYDAVIGYLSASREWAAISGDAERWREWWSGARTDVRSYYFIGKDNIPFHTVIWPGMLQAYGGLQLPYDVPSNEYLNMYGRKFSKSRGNVIGINDVLERYQADAWRYALTAMAPEGTDVDFTWDDFVERVNNELLANWGNLTKRVLDFTFKRFEGKIPEPGPLTETDNALLTEIRGGFESVSHLYESVKLKAASVELRRLSQRVNQYLTERAPWTLIKTDTAAAGTAVYVALQAIDWLKVLWSPILPHSSQQLHEMLGYDGPLYGRQFTESVNDARGEHLVLRYDHSPATARWEAEPLRAGQALREPAALFIKLDEKLVEAEGGPQSADKT